VNKHVNKLIVRACSRLQTEHVWGKPTYAIFEMSSKCNLKCTLCNTGALKNEFPGVVRGNMSFDTFRSGLDKLMPELEYILLYDWGEPFLNKDLYKCIEYATSKGVETRMSTNMTLYTPQAGDALIGAGLTKIIVSCDGLTQQTYEKYRQGGKLAKVVENTRDLIARKRNMRSSSPHITMQFIVFKHNEHERPEFKSFWEREGADEVDFIRMSYMSKQGQELANKLDYVPEDPDFQPIHPYGQLTRCSEFYRNVTIDWNGDWFTCCFPSGMQEYKLGNIVTDDFWTVWNGEKYRYCRRVVKTQKSTGGPFETMCHDCAGVHPEGTKRYW
jgi:MoaA/NifB/PqqE/SkfB family radical SAM enzyme